MGALTSKPTAFNFRTWDVNSVMYTSCQDSLVPLIRVDIYQKKVVRVLPLEDWISDNIRFLFLNLDKQTLKFPGLIFKLKSSKVFDKVKRVLRQHTYISVINYLIKRINKKRLNKLSLNLILGSVFTKNINLYHRLNTGMTNVNLICKKSLLHLDQKPDVSKYNDILLLDVNPRLDSPLLNLSLKDLDTDFFNVIAVGNFNTNYDVVINNAKVVLNSGEKSLIIYSENFKDNEFIFNLNNTKYNISPVYLNTPSVIKKLPIELNNNIMNFDFCNAEDFRNVNSFNVKFSTHISKLDFDIYLPITNYFVSTGELVSIKGEKKLKMIRPSFSLKDYILSLSIILKKGTHKATKNSIKIYNFDLQQKYSLLKNRLSYIYNRILPLQK